MNTVAKSFPVGEAMPSWTPRLYPPKDKMIGEYCRLEPLSLEMHAVELYKSFRLNQSDSNWVYLPYGPFYEFDAFKIWLDSCARSEDPLFYTVVENSSDEAVGIASYLRIEPAIGVIEVGHIHFSPRLQRTPMATEAMYLMMKRVFDELGYRRYEWKCDALNEPSFKAAARLGFKFEGIFRQATIYKGRNRDTAWFSIIDKEWPELKQALELWLSPENFDEEGRQVKSLVMFR